MRGINALRAADVKFSVLAVLTRESLHQIESVFDFFEAEGIHRIGFNLEEIKGVNSDWSFVADEDTLALYQTFAHKASIRQSRGTLDIREISTIEQRLRNHPSSAILAVRPLQFVTVGVDGGFSTYCPELHGLKYADGTRHVFGNVVRNEFLDIMANPQFLSLYSAVMEGVAKCARSCDRFPICGSHRVGVKFFENGTFSSSETLQCKARIKAVADVIETNSRGKDAVAGLDGIRREASARTIMAN
jgi:uncharacterized protein